MTQVKITREQWLEAAVHAIAVANPSVTLPPVKVSCSWPGGGSARKRIGECWARRMSKAGINEIFISPKIEASDRVVSILTHELAHAIDDCKNGHKAGYVKIAKTLGLEGKPTQMELPPELANAIANAVIAKVGVFPHSTLDLSSRKKQTTRMLKLECGACGAVWRMAAKHAINVTACPCCQTEMAGDGSDDEDGDD
jgi:hypothetical protein